MIDQARYEAPNLGIPPQYQEYARVFSEKEASTLPSDRAVHEIQLLNRKSPLYSPLFTMSQLELEALRKYLDEMLKKGWIRESSGPAAALVLFVKKPDRGLHLCIDYWGLNAITVKNQYPLPQINKLMDRIQGAKFFTKLDLRDAYHHIYIWRGDKWKMAFRTRYG